MASGVALRSGVAGGVSGFEPGADARLNSAVNAPGAAGVEGAAIAGGSAAFEDNGAAGGSERLRTLKNALNPPESEVPAADGGAAAGGFGGLLPVAAALDRTGSGFGDASAGVAARNIAVRLSWDWPGSAGVCAAAEFGDESAPWTSAKALVSENGSLLAAPAAAVPGRDAPFASGVQPWD